jgi:hypothetical protein
MNDLLQASGYAALVYLAFNYLVSFGSGKPLADWINPGRHYLPWLAAGLFGLGYSLLARAAARYDQKHADLLSALVNAESARYEVIGTVMFAVLGLTTLLLWVWCVWNLPRDPRTFNPNPKDLTAEFRRAVRHYVRWKGGLDYAFVCEVRNGDHARLAEGSTDGDIARGVARLPAVGTAEVQLDPRKAAATQKELWQQQAKRVFDDLHRLDGLVVGSRQGVNVCLSFDVRYGAFYFEMLERPDPDAGGDVWLYLFATCLNEHDVNSMTASRHFYMLAEALRHVRRGVTKR